MPTAHKASVSVEGARGVDVFDFYGGFIGVSFIDAKRESDSILLLATREDLEAMMRSLEAFFLEKSLSEKGARLDLLA